MGDVSADLEQIFRAQKRFPSRPSWKARDSEWFQLTSPLDIAGVTVEGLRFTASAMQRRPEESVSFQLEFTPPRRQARGGPFDRIEWRSIQPHWNKQTGPREHWNRQITGTHRHPFQVNWDANQGGVRRGDLPIALEIRPEPSFEDILVFVGKEFRISNIDWLSRPDWEATLF
jgi:hypothetical protein